MAQISIGIYTTDGRSADGKINGTADGMEYSGDGGETWRPVTADPTLVPAGTCLVRARATSVAPHGRPAELTVGGTDPVVTVAAHVQSKGWLAAVSGGAVAGTTGQSRRAEAVQVVIVHKGDPAPPKTYQVEAFISSRAGCGIRTGPPSRSPAHTPKGMVPQPGTSWRAERRP